MIEIRSSPIHDRGVFATQDIKKGIVICADPVVIFGKDDRDRILGTTTLWRYHWNWSNDQYCLVLGHGSLMNHSLVPNVAIKVRRRERLMVFKTIYEIKKNKELFIDYRRA